MNSTQCNPRTKWAIETIELTELIRGREQWLLERMTPLVRRQDVCLDLSSVERIDAAGVAALISLYGIALSSGHFFTICGASRRVMEILALVGLDRILLSHNAVRDSHSGPQFERPAA